MSRSKVRLALAIVLTSAALPVSAQEISSTGSPIVIGRSWRLPSRALGAHRVLNVWTPPSYERGNRRYPVLYVIDGGLEQDFHHVSGLAQLGALSWLTQDMIVVGVETIDRRRELAFAPRDPALRREFPTAGASDLFRRYLIDEVRPFIDARYRTDGHRALLGESLAGLFILETFLRAPESFDTYIAMDPSLWWDGGRLSAEAPALLARHRDTGRRLWLSIGRETSQQSQHADRMVTALRARPTSALSFRYEPRPALTHATIYHPTAWEALQALYPRSAE